MFILSTLALKSRQIFYDIHIISLFFKLTTVEFCMHLRNLRALLVELCSYCRTLGHFTAVHDRSSNWDGIDRRMRMNSRQLQLSGFKDASRSVELIARLEKTLIFGSKH